MYKDLPPVGRVLIDCVVDVILSKNGNTNVIHIGKILKSSTSDRRIMDLFVDSINCVVLASISGNNRAAKS